MMTILNNPDLAGFYALAAVAIFASLRVVTHANPVHAILSMIVSLLAVAGIMFILGAPFAGALEIIVYAGAILVLFVFVIMMLNLGEKGDQQERHWLQPKIWIGPALLVTLLFIELLYVIARVEGPVSVTSVSAKEVGLSLFGPYVLAVEIASMLLLAGLVGSFHLGRRYLDRDGIEKEGEQ